ncbi:MAG TPA: hypothetical protein VH208_11825 [Myxococcaceae bacterium]|nr:hypothetical protein [Myxococcaceae bacterium]
MNIRSLIDTALTIAEQAQGAAIASAIVAEVKKIEDPAEQAVTAQIFADVATGLKS